MGLIWTSGIPSQTSSYPGDGFLALGIQNHMFHRNYRFIVQSLCQEFLGDSYQACIHQGDISGI
jgi:hypothetical protein